MLRHPRAPIYARAHNELDAFICDLVKKHYLTYGELFGILGQLTCSWARWLVKDERKEDNG